MKIVSWNCAGGLRKKFSALEAISADVFVLQECENPALSQDLAYKAWASNYLWIGENKNKGLAVVASADIKLTKLDWVDNQLQLFLPCLINDEITLLAVWTKQANSPNFRYIGQLWKYLQIHEEKLSKGKTLLIGDLNSNSRWDEWDRWWNHTDVVNQLNNIGIKSLYHHQYQEEQGVESVKTFYMYRNLEKFYHIDYAFLSDDLLKNASLEIGLAKDWLALSDHMPLIVNI
jgi:exonuclease III